MSVEVAASAGKSPARRSSAEPIWVRSYRPLWVRSTNAVGAALKAVGLRVPKLEPAALLKRAERTTGLHDWGDDDFREGLAALVDAFEAQDNAHTFGRVFFRKYCTRLLVNRLKIQDDLKRYPEIQSVPIRRPLFVTGLARSGTTFLHRLLAEDPAGRPLLTWEMREPSPPPRLETRQTDPRIARVRASLRLLERLAPQITAAHYFDAESAEECNGLFAHAFIARIIPFIFDAPGYGEWLDRQDLRRGYHYLRTQLQLLEWRCPGNHWVLKSPAHLFGLDALLAVFPDACVVQTHRDPLQVVPSLCSLASAFRGIIADRVDLRRLGAELTEAMAKATERAIAARASADPARFLDVVYPRLLADPIGVVRDIYRWFDYSYTTEFEDRMRRCLVESPQHKHGVHRYSLAQFGLDAATVNAQFANYLEWLNRLPQPRRLVARRSAQGRLGM